MSTGMRASMAAMRMRVRMMKHREPMMDQHTMWRTEAIVALTWEPVMSTGMSARMVMMWMWMRRNMNRKLMMDQRRMWRTKRIVLDSVKIRLYFSDL